MGVSWTLFPCIFLMLVQSTHSFLSQQGRACSSISRSASPSNPPENTDDDESTRLRKKAEELREQIRKMEESLGESRPRNYDMPTEASVNEEVETEMSLRKKRVLVVGANGRLGSMVCKHLLRNNPETEVVACVHYIGEDSPTSRGYARLSYEVGAEDGVGSIGAAWSAEDRVATFEYADYMKDYNLQNLRLVECELLDPVQCNTICEGVDSVIWCATDFNGNQPRAISGFNVAFLFRAVASPTKGRVEVEGLRNILGGLKLAKQESAQAGKQPINFVLVSVAPDALPDFETPFGTFQGLKREGEEIVRNEFPSVSHTVLQMGRYDDNFVEEGRDIEFDEAKPSLEEDSDFRRRRINRRDAARAAVESLTNEDVQGKIYQVFSDSKK